MTSKRIGLPGLGARRSGAVPRLDALHVGKPGEIEQDLSEARLVGASRRLPLTRATGRCGVSQEGRGRIDALDLLRVCALGGETELVAHGV